MAATSGLTVRQHERQGIEMPVEFVIAPEHARQVHFSNLSNAVGPLVVRGEATDISSGGIGVKCRQFLPRMCEGTLRVLRPNGVNADGSPLMEPVFEQPAKVRRVTMIGREPMYALGLAFVDADAEVDQRVATLMSHLQPGGGDA